MKLFQELDWTGTLTVVPFRMNRQQKAALQSQINFAGATGLTSSPVTNVAGHRPIIGQNAASFRFIKARIFTNT